MHTARASLVAAMLLAGCATAPEVSIVRYGATGIDRDTTIATVLLYQEHCAEHLERSDTNCAPAEITAAMNREVAACFERAFEGTRHRVRVVPGELFREQVLAGNRPRDEPLDQPKLLALLAGTAVQERLREKAIDYTVLLSMVTRDSHRRTVFDAAHYAWGIGRKSTRRTLLTATVWSTERSEVAGVLEQEAVGETGWVVPVLVVLPLPPVPYGSDTESKSCGAMGNALVEFLYSDALPVQ